MHENNESDLSTFKLNKLPQFPRLSTLNLNIAFEKPIEKVEQSEQKESQQKGKKKKSREVTTQNVNNENTIIFQLGSSITKKKCVDAIKRKEDVEEKNPFVSRKSSPEELAGHQSTPEDLLLLEKGSSIGEIERVYKGVLVASADISESRKNLSGEISKMIAEMSHFKESLVDYWIELTLTQAKSMNNHSEINSNADTVLNQALAKQELF